MVLAANTQHMHTQMYNRETTNIISQQETSFINFSPYIAALAVNGVYRVAEEHRGSFVFSIPQPVISYTPHPTGLLETLIFFSSVLMSYPDTLDKNMLVDMVGDKLIEHPNKPHMILK